MKTVKKVRKKPTAERKVFKEYWKRMIIGLVAGGIFIAVSILYLPRWAEQATLRPGLSWFFLGIAVFFVWIRGLPFGRSFEDRLSFRMECGLFGFLFLVALVVRVWKIHEIPSGLFVDQGFQGLAALKILKEGWRPFWIEETWHAPAYALYGLAAWFGLFGADIVTLRLFYVFHALAALPFWYWSFRELAGARLALLGLAFLATQRWHVNFSRNGFPNIQILLYLGAALAFFLFGWRVKKKWPFLVSALALALGCYTYQAFKAVPIFFAWILLFFFLHDKKEVLARKRFLLAWAVVFVVGTAPYGMYVIGKKDALNREKSVSIFSKMQEEKSLEPLIDNVVETTLMFHRRGDRQPRHNLQDAPMVDPVTGVLFPLGFVLALRFLRNRLFFVALMGVVVMSLPCLLSRDAAHANRMIGITPFLAVLTALPLYGIWSLFRMEYKKNTRVFETGWGLSVVSIWLVASFMNLKVYFHDQAGHYYSWKEYSIEPTLVGKKIVEAGERYEYRLPPSFYSHHTLNFITYSLQAQKKLFLYPTDFLPQEAAVRGLGLAFLVEEGRENVVRFLEKLYPASRSETFVDPKGRPLWTWVWVEPDGVRKVSGLKGKLDQKPVHFSFFPEGLSETKGEALLSGVLEIPYSDFYRLGSMPSGLQLFVVGAQKLQREHEVFLAKGVYPVRLRWNISSERVSFSLFSNRHGGVLLEGRYWAAVTLPGQGILGKYYSNGDFSEPPVFQRRDPFLSFMDGNELILKDLPISIRWEGFIDISKTGVWGWESIANEKAVFYLDGRKVPLQPAGEGRPFVETGRTFLQKGKHRLRVDFQKLTGYGAFYELRWVPPGSETSEPVPPEAFLGLE